MQIFVIFLAFLPALKSQEVTIPVGEKGNDTLTVIRSDDGEGNYDMGYNENQLTGGASFYRERGFANGTRTGSYGYTTRSGLIRIVTYIADKDGYRAEVLTNEPGVAPENPSDVTVTKEAEPDLGFSIPSASATPQASNLNNPASSVLYASGSNLVRDYVLYGSESTVDNKNVNKMIPTYYYGERIV